MEATCKVEVENLVILALQSGSFVAGFPFTIDRYFRHFDDKEICRFTWEDVSQNVRELVIAKLPGIERHGYAFVT